MSVRIEARVNGAFKSYEYVDFTVNDCPSCGVVYALTKEYEARRREDGKFWHCPNGHSVMFIKSESERQRERAESLARQLEYARSGQQAARDQAHAAERSARAYKGHLTRLRNRVANGVCPVSGCHRNFANVKAHVTTKHPEWASEHSEVLA